MDGCPSASARISRWAATAASFAVVTAAPLTSASACARWRTSRSFQPRIASAKSVASGAGRTCRSAGRTGIGATVRPSMWTSLPSTIRPLSSSQFSNTSRTTPTSDAMACGRVGMTLAEPGSPPNTGQLSGQ
ncbi:hypothetical protein [Azospirillum brasilense]|uniref:hypothetical protein n=1 Tax=Azospirillum brasilense TaxID=192 RepID=UPI000555E47D|nr:hypothetical protein [Azospirillum brasilense]